MSKRKKRKRKRGYRTRARSEAEQNPVLKLWNAFKTNDELFEECRAYSVEDFLRTYGLTKVAAERLYQMFRQYEKGEIT